MKLNCVYGIYRTWFYEIQVDSFYSAIEMVDINVNKISLLAEYDGKCYTYRRFKNIFDLETYINNYEG